MLTSGSMPPRSIEIQNLNQNTTRKRVCLEQLECRNYWQFCSKFYIVTYTYTRAESTLSSKFL